MTSPVMLDHTAYPYIIDNILGYASPDTLLAFCSTSKHYRKKLAKWLSHATIHRNSYSSTSYFMSRVTPILQDLPFVPSSVQVLDVSDECRCSDSDLYFGSDEGDPAFPQLRVLRRMYSGICDTELCDSRGGDSDVPAFDTVIDFIDFDYHQDRSHEPWITWITLDAKTSRYIVHLATSNHVTIEEVAENLTLHVRSPDKSLNVIIVLWPHDEDRGDPLPRTAIIMVGTILDQVSQCFSSTRHCSSTTTITVVGGEAFGFSQDVTPPEHQDASHTSATAPKQSFRAQLHDRLYEFVTPVALDTAHTLLNDHTTFLTLDEWHSSLGEAEAVLGEEWPQ